MCSCHVYLCECETLSTLPVPNWTFVVFHRIGMFFECPLSIPTTSVLISLKHCAWNIFRGRLPSVSLAHIILVRAGPNYSFGRWRKKILWQLCSASTYKDPRVFCKPAVNGFILSYIRPLDNNYFLSFIKQFKGLIPLSLCKSSN